jgi:hypothetical protein
VVEEEDAAKDKRWKGAANNNSMTSSSKQMRTSYEDSPPPAGRGVKHKPRPGGGGCLPQSKLGCGELTTRQGELLPVLEGRLYFICVSSSSAFQPKEDELWLTLSKAMLYTPLCADFGPLNLGTTHAWCGKLHALLASPKHLGTKIIVYTSMEASDITNMITLLGAFLCLRMGYSVEDALRPFKSLHHSLIIPFRDATWVKSTFDLHVWVRKRVFFYVRVSAGARARGIAFNIRIYEQACFEIYPGLSVRSSTSCAHGNIQARPL